MSDAVQQLADRLEIESVIIAYAWALDSKQFDRLDDVFTPDASLDYTTSGGVKGAYPEVKAWLAGILPHFPVYQHLVSNIEVTLDGDTATSRTALYNPMGHDRDDGTRAFFYVGAEYHDQWSRTPQGWRITDRFEQTVWMDGELPARMPG